MGHQIFQKENYKGSNMKFKTWIENEQYVKPGTIVYRGLKIGPEGRKQTLRQLLSKDYFNRGRNYDHWSLEFDVAKSFARGVHLNPDGTSGDKTQTVHVIVAAKIGPEDVDTKEFSNVLSGNNYNHLNGGSYFNTSLQHIDGQEQEIPVLRSSYSKIPLVNYWINTGSGWQVGDKPAALA